MAHLGRLYLASFIRAEIGRNFRLGSAETFDRISSKGGGKLFQHDRRMGIQDVYVCRVVAMYTTVLVLLLIQGLTNAFAVHSLIVAVP